MYAQFFGGYLLSKEAVTPEQLTSAISHLSDTHIKSASHRKRLPCYCPGTIVRTYAGLRAVA